MDEHPELYRNWMGWVKENLGHDLRFAPVAAAAAAEAAGRGEGFQRSAQAARLAWEGAAGRGIQPVATGRWEKDVFIAWTFLALAWVWPITPVILNWAPTFDRDRSLLQLYMALMDVFVIPICAIAAIIYGHGARGHIKRTGDRGKDLATAALVLGYITLLTSPISIVGFVFAAGVIPPLCGCV